MEPFACGKSNSCLKPDLGFHINDLILLVRDCFDINPQTSPAFAVNFYSFPQFTHFLRIEVSVLIIELNTSIADSVPNLDVRDPNRIFAVVNNDQIKQRDQRLVRVIIRKVLDSRDILQDDLAPNLTISPSHIEIYKRDHKGDRRKPGLDRLPKVFHVIFNSIKNPGVSNVN